MRVLVKRDPKTRSPQNRDLPSSQILKWSSRNRKKKGDGVVFLSKEAKLKEKKNIKKVEPPKKKQPPVQNSATKEEVSRKKDKEL